MTEPEEPNPVARPVNRRRFLQSAGAGLLGAGAAVTIDRVVSAGATTPEQAPSPVQASGDGTLSAVPFHGEHQAGILTPRPPAAVFVAFDTFVDNKAELRDLFQEVTTQARRLTAGGAPTDLGADAPPSDSGILGPTVPADALTITVSVGASLFDDRYGLSAQKPKRLSTMEPFPNDNLNQAECHGDLMMQICAGSTDTTLHALRILAKTTRGAMVARYRIDGFVSPPRPSGAPRNLLGFNDGIAHPEVSAPAVANALLWASSDEPSWAQGGSYQAVRIIRMFTEFWDRVSVEEQENMIGRRRSNGAPLTGNAQDDIPDYASDKLGQVIPLSAHIRVANPRTPKTEENLLLRRGYNYDRGLDVNGNLDMGLIFACYQQDLVRQFQTVQKRLIDEPMVDYISPTGGGYYFVLPGVRDTNDYYASKLLA